MWRVGSQPLIFEIDPLLTDDECEHIIRKAEPEMANSPVSPHTVAAALCAALLGGAHRLLG